MPRNRPPILSITHKLRAEGGAEGDVGEAGEAAPDDRTKNCLFMCNHVEEDIEHFSSVVVITLYQEG